MPFRRHTIEQPDPDELDKEPDTKDPYKRAWWQKEHAERRIVEILNALDQAKRTAMPTKQVASLEAAYRHEAEMYVTALDQLGYS